MHAPWNKTLAESQHCCNKMTTNSLASSVSFTTSLLLLNTVDAIFGQLHNTATQKGHGNLALTTLHVCVFRQRLEKQSSMTRTLSAWVRCVISHQPEQVCNRANRQAIATNIFPNAGNPAALHVHMPNMVTAQHHHFACLSRAQTTQQDQTPWVAN